MFSAERRTPVPAVVVTMLCDGLSGAKTVAPVQVSAPNALSRLPLTVTDDRFGFASPPARIRFLIARQSRPGSCALSSAATPATCGAAIDVPLNVR